jgi:cubilin
MNCTWIIRAPLNRVARFKFESLELEFHSKCVYDYVKIFDGEAIRPEKLLGTFCGNLTQDMHPLLSKGRSMLLQFSTDWVIEHGGFSGVVDFTSGENQGCGGHKNVTSGGQPVTIQSVDIDSNGKYEEMLDCQWLVGGPDYQGLELTFESFSLEGGERTPGKNVSRGGDDEGCPYDYLEMRDGPGPYSQLLGKFCGNAVPPPILSSTNFMWIRFVSDSSYNFPGFRARIINKPCKKDNYILKYFYS